MSRALDRRQTPEEAELTRRKLQLSALRAALADREKSLAELRAHLHSFEGRYIRQVGVLYKQLDEWEQKIVEPDSPLVVPEGTDTQGTEAARPEEEPDSKAATSGNPDTTLDLKALFRELARRVHPDFASDEADAQHRTRLMTEANDAFRRKDAEMLQRMLHGHETSRPRETIAEELARTLMQLTELNRSIAQADAQITALTQSEMAKLRERTLVAAQSGRDLLAEMAARVKGNIGMAMRRYELDLERRKRRQAPLDPASFLSAELNRPEASGARHR